VGVNQPLTIHIDVLAIEGMDSARAAELGSEFESALGRLIESRGVPRALSRPGEQPAIEIEAPSAIRGPADAGTLAEILYRRLDE
jgi:hypothetical protein